MRNGKKPPPLGEGQSTTDSPILTAALSYAARGWFIFPAHKSGEKKSHKSAEHTPSGLPWGMSVDEKEIRTDFKKFEGCNVSIVTGEVSGIFVVENDTKTGHAVDGALNLTKWEEINGALPPTLMAESPSGSVHRYFKHPGKKVWSSSNNIAPGVDCKGDGGMVIAPPSVRPDKPDKPGGVYRWLNEGHPIADAPAALLEIVCKPSPKKNKDMASKADDDDDETKEWNNFYTRYSTSSKGGFTGGSNKWRNFNTDMLQHLSLWFPPLFHDKTEIYQNGFTISSAALGRKLQERISALPIGIYDFGLERGYTPIDLVKKYLHTDFEGAVAWLIEMTGIEPKNDIDEEEEEEDNTTTNPNAPPPNPADAKFTKTTHGNVADTQRNIRLALKKLGVSVRYNLFEDRPTVEGLDGFHSLNDAAMDRLWLTIDKRFKFRPTKEFFWTVVFDEARLNSFHPIREYLDDLTWDGVERIDTWLIEYGHAEDTPYTRAVGALFLVAAVRRVRSPGVKFDEMVVFHSDQGFDKSSALAILAVHPEWFSDDLPLNADSKKTIERLRGRWIVEAAELKGMRHGDVEHLKAFLSRTVDRARMSYDRTTTELYRQCVIAGTTNHEKFLRDQTGNRRFWPVRNIKFDLAKLKQDRDQLWAEASAREAEGVSIRLPKELWADAGVEQEEHTIEEPWIEIINDHLAGIKGKLLCTDAWLLVEVPIAQRTQVHNERLGIAMKACGWTRKKQRFDDKKIHWAYVPEKTPKKEKLHQVAISTDGAGHVTLVYLAKKRF